MNWKFTTFAVAGTLVFAAATMTYGADAKETWDKSCAMCHGKDGKGQTTMGKKMSLKDYTDAKVQEALKDEDLTKAIKEGVKEGDKVKMKGYDKLSDDEVKALVAYIRAFKK